MHERTLPSTWGMWLENATRSLRAHAAKRRFFRNPADTRALIDFVANASFTNRFMPREQPTWNKWVDAFLSSYKLETDERRQAIREDIQTLSPYQQVGVVELLWESTEGSDRPYWLKDLFTHLWHGSAEDEETRKAFISGVRNSSLPYTLKQEVLEADIFPDR